MSEPKKKLLNRVTCTLCGDQAERETIAQIIEWDKAHICPKKGARTLADDVKAGLHDEPHP